ARRTGGLVDPAGVEPCLPLSEFGQLGRQTGPHPFRIEDLSRCTGSIGTARAGDGPGVREIGIVRTAARRLLPRGRSKAEEQGAATVLERDQRIRPVEMAEPGAAIREVVFVRREAPPGE